MLPSPSHNTDKRLILMRHAHSSPLSDALRDHDRSLSDIGRTQAPLTGAKLININWIPDRVLCSDAQRTRETWKLIASFFPHAEIQITPLLYHAHPNDVLELMAMQPEPVQTLMIVGHNPYLESMTLWLSERSLSMDTAQAALLTHEYSAWPQVMHEQGEWELMTVLSPEN